MTGNLEIIKQLEKELKTELKQLKKIDFREPEIGYVLDENKNVTGLCLYNRLVAN